MASGLAGVVGAPLRFTSRFNVARLKCLDHARLYINERDGKNYPSVTTILQHSRRDDTALQNWIDNQIKVLGFQGYRDEMKRHSEDGTRVHSIIEEYLAGIGSDIETPIESGKRFQPDVSGYSNRVKNMWKSLESVVADIDYVAAVETSVFHDTLAYAGTIDCIARYKGQLKIIDWKTSKRRKDSISKLFDYPIQLSAYLGALYSDNRYPPEVKPTSGIVVVMYEDHPADVVDISKAEMEEAWEKWLVRYSDFQYVLDNGHMPSDSS
mmetsp:Transcript_6637/g.10251  ORF Transcript_6637/g.10251 Transcript_6637/m.10251 type:complete len:267 (-) Transcript_6637:30-830(-)